MGEIKYNKLELRGIKRKMQSARGEIIEGQNVKIKTIIMATTRVFAKTSS